MQLPYIQVCVWLYATPYNSLGQNTGVGSLSLLQGIFPTQGSNPGLPHCRLIIYQMSHKGSPRIVEWVAYPFPRGSSRPRNRTRVSCSAGGFFTNWAIREAAYIHKYTYTKMCVKTGELQIRSIPELMVLYQSQFPGFDNVVWLYKILSLEEAGWKVYGNPWYYFLKLVMSISKFFNYVF